MVEFGAIFVASLVSSALITLRSSELYKVWSGKNASNKDTDVTAESTKAHKTLIRKYIIVYLLATMGDWLQGPFVYALYMDYGFAKIEIAQFFVAGFASSMVLGSFVGGMADWGGRRNFVIIYALVNIVSCMTKREFLYSDFVHERRVFLSLIWFYI
jgi:Na+/melibiose symporter-like transporter